MICLGSLYNRAKQKVQLFVSWSVAVSVGPVHNQAHSHQDLHCCRKLSVMEGTGQHPSWGCASSHSSWESPAQRDSGQICHVRAAEKGRSRKVFKKKKQQTKPNLSTPWGLWSGVVSSPMQNGRYPGLPMAEGRPCHRRVTQQVSV